MDNLENLSKEELRELFVESLKKSLAGISSKRLVELSWRCSMRMLPFFVSNEEFLLDINIRQQLLYAFFCQLDVSLAYIYSPIDDANPDLPALEESISNIATVNATAISGCGKEISKYYLEDIKAAKENKPFPPLGGVAVYGDIWHSFRIAMAADGLDYWGGLFEEMYEKGVDLEKLQKRLMVPAEIQKKGVAEVAKYLKSLETEKE